MNKEIISKETFREKIFKEYLKNFKNNKWNFDGNDNERVQFLSDFFANESPDYGYEKFHKALITEHVNLYDFKSNLNSANFFKDLVFGSEMVGYSIGFTENVEFNSIFSKLEEQHKKLLHNYFYVRKIQEDLFSNLLISSKTIIESFRFNNIEYSPDFFLKDEIYNILNSIMGLNTQSDTNLKNAQFFQNYLIEDLNYNLKHEKLDEEDIENIEKTMSSFWFINNSSGYRLSSMYIEYLDFLRKAENTYFKDIALLTRREHFVSYIVGSDGLLNKEDVLSYITPQWNDINLIIINNSIKIQENNLLVFDINKLFNVDNETNISKFFKRAKYINSMKIDREDGSDYLSLSWELNENISLDKKEKINETILIFFKDKLYNIDIYANDLATVSERLKNECRELELLITLNQKEEKNIRKYKI